MAVETLHFDFHNNTKMFHSVSKKSILSKLDECINSIVKKEGYISCDVKKKMLPADGGNYLAKLFEIDVKGKTDEGDKETAIFVKSIDSDCEVMELISIPQAYKTELFVYKELIYIFNELQADANVPINERYNTVKCYEESYERAVIMENITKKGFNLPGHRMDIITLKMAEECIKQLAKFHALSFVLEQRKPEYFAEKIKLLTIPHKFGEAWEKIIDTICKMGLECLNEELRSKIEDKMPKILKKIEEYYTDESIMHCLCHGDYRPNNIMVKEIDSIVTIIPVDYQLVAFGCPVFDFIYFMYCSTDRQFRNSHMIHLKNCYYNSLEDFLRYFDMSAKSVFSKEIFEHLYEEKLDFGLAMMFVAGPFLFVSEDVEFPDLTKEAMDKINFKLDDKFKHRLRDAVEEFIDMGYL